MRLDIDEAELERWLAQGAEEFRRRMREHLDARRPDPAESAVRWTPVLEQHEKVVRMLEEARRAGAERRGTV